MSNQFKRGDWSELKRLAEVATPGPWGRDGSYVCPVRVEGGTTYIESWRAIADSHHLEDVRYIAAANPAAILALIAENERLCKFEAAWGEWWAKTEWVQQTAVPAEFGIHRADVLRARIDQLHAEVECLRQQVATLQSSPDSWQSGYDKGRADGTRARLSELEQERQINRKLRADLDSAERRLSVMQRAAARRCTCLTHEQAEECKKPCGNWLAHDDVYELSIIDAMGNGGRADG